MSDLTGGSDLPDPFPPAPPPPPPPPGMAPPPGYTAYGGQSFGAYTPFQKVAGIGRTLGILLIILIPVQLISMLVTASIHGKARDYLNEKISETSFKNSIATTGLVSLLSGVLTLAIAVLTMIWMFRMAKNQRQMDRLGTWGPGWAIGGWFVPPCVLYVVPYLMFRDLWKSSDPDPSPDWRTNRISPVVHVWWVLFGLAPLATLTVTFSRFKISSRSTAQAARDLDKSIAINLLSTAVQIAAAVAFLMLVRQLTQRHARVDARDPMIFLVRHAKAGSRHNDLPDDTIRPLSKAGWRQASALVDPLIAAGASGPLFSSTYLRCIQTLGPLAEQLGMAVEPDERLAEAQHFEPMLDLMTTTPDGTVLCSHGDMIPEVMVALERRGCEIVTEPNWKKASVWVLTRDRHSNFTHAASWPPPVD